MPLADDRLRAHRRAVDARCGGHSTILQIPQAVLRMSPVRGTASPTGRARKVTTFPSRSGYGPMSTTSSSNTSAWMREPMNALVRSRCASALASVSRRGLSAARGNVRGFTLWLHRHRYVTLLSLLERVAIVASTRPATSPRRCRRGFSHQQQWPSRDHLIHPMPSHRSHPLPAPQQ